MKRNRTFYGWLLAGIVLTSCEDIINPGLEKASPVLVVDAWINNKPGVQEILLTMSQPYFENTLPPGVSGAAVTVKDDKGGTFNFIEDDKHPGRYVWTPVASEVFGMVENLYELTIVLNGEIFRSTSKMGRVPLIDSITYRKDKRITSNDSLTRGQFWATDPVGRGDAYWIRTHKNGILLNKPSEINIAFDAGFSEGGNADGVTFITPVRFRINSSDLDSDGRPVSPIVPGDSLNVQIFSITKEAFEHLNQVIIQTNRPGGFSELFARPLSNVSTNVVNVNPDGSPVVGFFNVSAVSTLGKRYEE